MPLAILLNTVEGVRSVDEVLRDTARSYRLGRLTTLRQVVLRGASPRIAAGARQALSIGVILMVISELFGANRGLGAAIVQFQRVLLVAGGCWQMLGAVLLVGACPVALAVPPRTSSQFERQFAKLDPMKGDRVEIVVDAGDATRTYDVVATRAGRRVEISIGRGVVEVVEVTRNGAPVRTARFMASKVLALVEHPATARALDDERGD